MAQLTWKTIDAPNFSGSNELVKLSATLMNKGFEAGTKTIDDWQEGQTKIAGAQLMRDAIQEQDPAVLKEKLRNGTFLAGRDPTYLDPKALGFVNDQQRQLLQTEGQALGNKQTVAQTTGLDLRNTYDSRTLEDRVAQEALQTQQGQTTLDFDRANNPLRLKDNELKVRLGEATLDSDVTIKANQAASGTEDVIAKRLTASREAAKPAWEQRKQEIMALENGTDADKLRAKEIAGSRETAAIAAAAGQDVTTVSSPTNIAGRVKSSLSSEQDFRDISLKRETFANDAIAKNLLPQLRTASTRDEALGLIASTANLSPEVAAQMATYVTNNPNLFPEKANTTGLSTDEDGVPQPAGLRMPATVRSQLAAAAGVRPTAVPNDPAMAAAATALAGGNPGSVAGVSPGGFVPGPGSARASAPSVDAILARRVGQTGPLGQGVSRGPTNQNATNRALGDVIAGTESSKQPGGGYDTVVGSGQYGKPPKPLTEMTLDEVNRFGKDVLIPNTKAAGVGKDPKTGQILGASASGRYQFVGGTMMQMARELGLDPSTTKFTPEVQDAMMARLASKPNGLENWEGLNKSPKAMAQARALVQGIGQANPDDLRTQLASAARPAAQTAAAVAAPGLAPEDVRVPISTQVGETIASAAAVPQRIDTPTVPVAATGVQAALSSRLGGEAKQRTDEIQVLQDTYSTDALFDATEGYGKYLGNADRPLKGKTVTEVAAAMAKASGEKGIPFADADAGIQTVMQTFGIKDADAAAFLFNQNKKYTAPGYSWNPFGAVGGYAPDLEKIANVIGRNKDGSTNTTKDRAKLIQDGIRTQREAEKDVKRLEDAKVNLEAARLDLRVKENRKASGFDVDVAGARSRLEKRLSAYEKLMTDLQKTGRPTSNQDRALEAKRPVVIAPVVRPGITVDQLG